MPAWELAPITWEAAATLTTGVLAVGAAIWVGRRQAAIFEKQTEIAEAVRAIEALKVKSELFDRRVAIFRAADNWMMEFMRTNDAPKGEISEVFMKACAEAKFLYSDDISQQLYHWRIQAQRYSAYKARLKDGPADKYQYFLQKVEAAEEVLMEASATLYETFKPALDLSDVR